MKRARLPVARTRKQPSHLVYFAIRNSNCALLRKRVPLVQRAEVSSCWDAFLPASDLPQAFWPHEGRSCKNDRLLADPVTGISGIYVPAA